MKKGRAGTMTHDYKRHGTTTLFAALNVLDGSVLGRCMQRHRHQEFIRFLNAIEANVPAGKIVHVILDNYAAHKQPKVLAWLARHPRFVFHFTPTSCSWLNAVETFFATLTKRRLKRGVFRSVVDLQAAINRYLDEANHDPKPFLWTARPRQDHRRRQPRAPSVRIDPLVVSNTAFLASMSTNSKICLLRSRSIFRFLPLRRFSQRSLYSFAATFELQRLRSFGLNGSRALHLGSSSSVVACSQVVDDLWRNVLAFLTQVICS